MSYGRGARVLSLGIASTGVVTFAYFSVSSYVLDDEDYKAISLLWSVLFVTVSVIYRPIEQLLSRTIAQRRAHGLERGHPMRTPMLIQAGFALAFLVVALLLRGPIQDDLFDGSAALYWILVTAVLAYAASYFARGWLAGHQWFALYGGLVFLESVSRLLFALAVAVGLAEGQTAVALGMAAAPFVSLVVVPLAFRRASDGDAARGGGAAGGATADGTPAAGGGGGAAGNGAVRGGAVAAGFSDEATAVDPADFSDEAAAAAARDELGLGRGGRFAVAVLAIMAAEQTLLNGAVITTDLTASDAAVAGFVFNVLLIARAPLQLFQAVQGSLLPHLAGLEARAGRDEARRAVRITLLAIAGFAGAVALGLLLIGPWAMSILFDDAAEYGRYGLALVALGMGFHLAAGTLNQAALARDHAAAAAAAWVAAAVVFVIWLVAPVVDDELIRAELGYVGAAALLCGLLALVDRHGEVSSATKVG